MAKKNVSFRFDAGTDAALRRLATDAGMSLNDALTEAITGWEVVLALVGEQVGMMFEPAEWCLLADVLGGTMIDCSWQSPGRFLAFEVEDAHRLNGTGFRWLSKTPTETAGGSLAIAGAVANLIGKLNSLDYASGWAVIHAVRWFWANQDISLTEQPWWLPSFRRRYARRERQQQEEGQKYEEQVKDRGKEEESCEP